MANSSKQQHPLSIALIGYGKMGRAIETAAASRGHTIAARIGSGSSWDAVAAADICIEFSHPTTAVTHIERIAALSKPCVVGTTGWYDALPHVEEIVTTSGIGLLYAPNFSIGIALYMKMIEAAAQLIEPYRDYDVACFEAHHNQKVDVPSGTGEAMTQLLESLLPDRAPLSFATMRCGHIPGNHSVIFDGPHETITLSHQSRSRSHFAEGALVAAEWLCGKRGLFTFDYLISEQLP